MTSQPSSSLKLKKDVVFLWVAEVISVLNNKGRMMIRTKLKKIYKFSFKKLMLYANTFLALLLNPHKF